MKLTQAIKMAFDSIKSNKLRSFLTMLGIIIGISSVIVLIAIGEGTKKDVADSIQGMGTNLITISITGSRDRSVTQKELDDLKTKDGIKEIAPSITGGVTAKIGNQNMQTMVEASVPSYEEIRNIHAAAGRFINQDDLDNRFRVAVIGTEIITTLRPDLTPQNYESLIGTTMSINGTNFKIVGILESKGSSTAGSNDNRIIIPLTTAQRFLRNKSIRTFYVESTSPDKVDAAMVNLQMFMLKKCNGDTNSFRVFNQSDLLATQGKAADNMTMMLAGVAAISLLVGGIGIMNIMLVSVTERTREIGIRKAIGANRGDILIQFLIEAIFISGVGGIIGVVFGISTASILPKIMKQSVVTSPSVIILSFSFAATVGIIFGLYPANKASKLKPIDALRYE